MIYNLYKDAINLNDEFHSFAWKLNESDNIKISDISS